MCICSWKLVCGSLLVAMHTHMSGCMMCTWPDFISFSSLRIEGRLINALIFIVQVQSDRDMTDVVYYSDFSLTFEWRLTLLRSYRKACGFNGVFDICSSENQYVYVYNQGNERTANESAANKHCLLVIEMLLATVGEYTLPARHWAGSGRKIIRLWKEWEGSK